MPCSSIFSCYVTLVAFFVTPILCFFPNSKIFLFFCIFPNSFCHFVFVLVSYKEVVFFQFVVSEYLLQTILKNHLQIYYDIQMEDYVLQLSFSSDSSTLVFDKTFLHSLHLNLHYKVYKYIQHHNTL